MRRFFFVLICAAVPSALSCVKLGDDAPASQPRSSRLSFDITVTREGVPVTKGDLLDAGDLVASMDCSRPFSLIAVDEGSGSLLMNNVPVYSESGGDYFTHLDGGILDIPSQVLFSAYYPRVRNVTYENDHTAYSIPFESTETDAGPLVSKTVERYVTELNTLPLEFGHITNDIGFKICDVTQTQNLQGLIHLKKLTAKHVASAGIYVNDLINSRGFWNYQGYYRDVVVFEGDAPVGVGSSNELFVGENTLVKHLSESKRFYAIPDEIVMGDQWVEVVFDVDGFFIEEEYYAPIKDQVAKYLIYGVLPNNIMVPGKQYTFHLGLDLASVYQQINFGASVSEWQTKIYEHNDDF